jgi:glycosyl transferase family 25
MSGTLPPAFVISLPGETKRREQVAAHLNERGIPFTFFDAVDGRNFDIHTMPVYNGARRRAYFGRDLRGGEVGCLLSHKGIAQKMIDDNIPHALVLEDDVVLSPDFAHVLTGVMALSYPWELVRFLGSAKVAASRQRTVAHIDDRYRLTRLSTAPGGAHAYLLSLSGARKLWQAFERIYLPVDMIMSRPWMTGIDLLTVQPGLAHQDLDLESSIGTVRDIKTPDDLRGWQRRIYPLTRAWFKLSDTVMRRVYYWAAWPKDMMGLSVKGD